jgi:hypothetical protein
MMPKKLTLEWETELNAALGSQVFRELERTIRDINSALVHVDWIKEWIAHNDENDRAVYVWGLRLKTAEALLKVHRENLASILEWTEVKMGKERGIALAKHIEVTS